MRKLDKLVEAAREFLVDHDLEVNGEAVLDLVEHEVCLTELERCYVLVLTESLDGA